MITVLDGGMGYEFKLRRVKVPDYTKSIWSALALLEDPEAVVDVHAAYLEAGATIVGGCCGTRPKHIKRLREMIG